MTTEATVEAAFRAGVKDIADNAPISKVRALIKAGDVTGAIAAMDIDNSAFDGLRAELVATYAQGGVSEVDGMKFSGVNVRWNSATSQSEDFARRIVGDNITSITQSMREAVRNEIGDGIAFGRSVNRIALDIAGRIDATGARTGGIVGLNDQQRQWVDNMRAYLSASPPDIDAINRMTKRDMRHQKAIEAAVKDGRTLTADQIDLITRNYANKLLLVRGKTIAVTERYSALNQGRAEAWRQAAEKLNVPVTAIRKQWKHAAGVRDPRISHQVASGDVVQGLNTPFNIGGTMMLYPHDPSAPASETINCHCQVKFSIPKEWRNG